MKGSAFTLIELLVVITIVAVLAAIVLPGLSASLEKARATEDLNNLRQLSIGLQQYVHENGDTMFPMTAPADAPWPAVLHQKYVANWQSFVSPFDRRTTAPANTLPVSYGLNIRTLVDDSKLPPSPSHFSGAISEFISPSELILLAPAPESTPEVQFSGTSAMNITIQPPATSPKLGTHGMRRWLDVLFADQHVSQLSWQDYSDSASKPTGLRRWFPLGF